MLCLGMQDSPIFLILTRNLFVEIVRQVTVPDANQGKGRSHVIGGKASGPGASVSGVDFIPEIGY